MSEILTCIMCPLGCEMRVERNDDVITVDGNKCEKGEQFAREELLHPIRNLATSVPISGRFYKMLSVRLSDRVPRSLLKDILKDIARLRPQPPVKRGQVLIHNVLESGADVIATRTVV
jgi:CxxC motif-containing protein